MNALLSTLQERGCEVADALAQFGGNEDFYAKRFKQLISGKHFEELGVAIVRRDADTAYEHAQQLRKGTADLGLTPISTLLAQIAQPLRTGSCDKSLEKIYKALMVQVKVYRILAVRDGNE